MKNTNKSDKNFKDKINPGTKIPTSQINSLKDHKQTFLEKTPTNHGKHLKDCKQNPGTKVQTNQSNGLKDHKQILVSKHQQVNQQFKRPYRILER